MAGYGMNVLKEDERTIFLVTLINICFNFILLHAYMFRVSVQFSDGL